MADITKININGSVYNLIADDIKTTLYCTDSDGETLDHNIHKVRLVYEPVHNTFILTDKVENKDPLIIRTYLSNQLSVRYNNDYTKDYVLSPWFDDTKHQVVLEGWDYHHKNSKAYYVRTEYSKYSNAMQCMDGEGIYYDGSHWTLRSRYLGTQSRFVLYAEEIKESNPGTYPVCTSDLQCYFHENQYDRTYPVFIRATWDLNKDSNFFLKAYGDGSQTWNVSVGRANTVAQTSSIRFKSDVKPIDNEILDNLHKINVVSFKYNEDSGRSKEEQEVTRYGFIAENVDKYYPDSVTKDLDGNPNSVVYSDFIPLLLGEIQRLNLRVTELEKKLSSMV